MTPAQVRHYLENLSQLWEDTEPEGRKAIAEAAFEQIDAVGLDVTVVPSAEAEHYGWAEAFGPDPLVCTIGRYGRGERSRADTFQISVTIADGNGESIVRRSSDVA